MWGIQHRSGAKDELGTYRRCPLHQLAEDLMSEIATIRELEHSHATIIASLDHLLANIDVTMEEHGDHAGLFHLYQHVNLRKFSHTLCSFLALNTT